MSAMQRSLFAVALLLGVAVGSATPASADSKTGIWVWIGANQTWTLTVINLTNYPLSLGANIAASGGQRPPFYGNELDGVDAFPLAPYRNVTWKSNTAPLAYPNARWDGVLMVAPQGKSSKWTSSLRFSEYWFSSCADNGCVQSAGTWVSLWVDPETNPGWLDYAPYNISCSYPTHYHQPYNVMTVSGTDLIVSLYAPSINVNTAPSVDITMVIKQRWPHPQILYGYQDSLVAPCLTYQENNAWTHAVCPGGCP